MAQTDKKFCLLHYLFQEPYIIWLPFMLQLCKMLISPGVFSFFSEFWFSGLLGVEGQKWPKMTRNSASCTSYLRNHTSYDCHLWCTYVKWWHDITKYFVHFFKILIFWVREVKGQKTAQNDKNSVCCTSYLRNHTLYDCHLWYTCVKWS